MNTHGNNAIAFDVLLWPDIWEETAVV
jgi:hypothetical protein